MPKIVKQRKQIQTFIVKQWKLFQWKQCQTLFLGAPKSLQMVTAVMKLRHLLLGRRIRTDPDTKLKNRDITLPTKVHLAKAMVFPVELDCEES